MQCAITNTLMSLVSLHLSNNLGHCGCISIQTENAHTLLLEDLYREKTQIHISDIIIHSILASKGLRHLPRRPHLSVSKIAGYYSKVSSDVPFWKTLILTEQTIIVN